MTNEFMPVIERYEQKLREQLAAVAETKRMINSLCRDAGLSERYADADASNIATRIGSIKGDTFYGKALATAVREFLEMRKAAALGPATVKEIHAALRSGGFQFDTKNDDNAMRGLRISMAKNTAMFHKLPSGEYGLRSWYPAIREKRERADQVESMEDEGPPDDGEQSLKS